MSKYLGCGASYPQKMGFSTKLSTFPHFDVSVGHNVVRVKKLLILPPINKNPLTTPKSEIHQLKLSTNYPH